MPNLLGIADENGVPVEYADHAFGEDRGVRRQEGEEKSEETGGSVSFNAISTRIRDRSSRSKIPSRRSFRRASASCIGMSRSSS